MNFIKSSLDSSLSALMPPVPLQALLITATAIAALALSFHIRPVFPIQDYHMTFDFPSCND